MTRINRCAVSAMTVAVVFLAAPITARGTLGADLVANKPVTAGAKTTKKTIVKTTEKTTVETIVETIEEPAETKNAPPSPASFRGTSESAQPLLSPSEKENMKRIEGETWRIVMDLNMPSLEPQSVQYAILDKDPVPAFMARVERMRTFTGQQLERAGNEARKEQLHAIQMQVSWDLGFREVTGDRLYLLAKRPDRRFSRHSNQSNAPAGKKWIVTKTVAIEGKPVCWCIPVDVQTGKSTNVTLENNNRFDLQTAYKKAMETGDEHAAR